MDANLDAQIKLTGLKSLSEKDVEVNGDYDDMFLSLYGDILKEADNIKTQVASAPVAETVKKKGENKKKIILVESILSDNDETFLRNVYVKVLGREPDRSGYDNYIAKLKSDKNFDREQLIYNFWNSDEGKRRNIEVIGFHKVYMDEMLSHDGMDFVEHAFLQLLTRKPDKNDGQNYYNALYKQGKSKEEIIRIIKDSPECQKRKVEVVGFEKAYRKRKKKEKILSTPIIGNAVLTSWNILHLNRRLEDINSGISDISRRTNTNYSELKDELDEAINTIKELRKELVISESRIRERENEILNLTETIKRLDNLEVDVDYLEKLNTLLSGRMTVWGSRDRLDISPKASVYTCFFNTNSGCISVGDYTFTGSNVSILAGSHDKNLKGLARRDADEKEGCDIIIGNGVWLGSNCTILGPCQIGDNAVIAAGSVIAPGTIVPANTVYGGVPAKQIGKELSFDDEYSESIIKALKRCGGILFTEGWSENAVFVYKGENEFGHYLLEPVGKVLLKTGEYSLKYSYNNDELTTLYIDDGEERNEFILREKEGEIKFNVKPASDNDFDCRYISFSVKTDETHFNNNGLVIYIK